MTTIRGTGGAPTATVQRNTETSTARQTAPAAPQQRTLAGHSAQSTFESTGELTREQKKQVLDQVLGPYRQKLEERYQQDGSFRSRDAAEEMLKELEADVLSGKVPLDANTLTEKLKTIGTASSAIGSSRDATWKQIFNQILEQFQKPVKWE
ncbi:hypothetical protein JRI60_16020 [Archangium violaceum]|jgi:hypothetical protein|uniref:hypothetical protein n=1 Tax=Archangium violaceum TaxID=83451 RepID=UPI001951F0A1|nr:hypothetical protein [Archangium violaceum]QRO00423.1 hypothetical protein JRI60_16020 [Archangium violaceum]